MPGIFNASLVDAVLDIHQQDAENTMRQLAVREGIFCGVSSGGAVAGALRIARENPGAVVVAIVCDRGDRYLSTGVFGEEHFSQGLAFNHQAGRCRRSYRPYTASARPASERHRWRAV